MQLNTRYFMLVTLIMVAILYITFQHSNSEVLETLPSETSEVKVFTSPDKEQTPKPSSKVKTDLVPPNEPAVESEFPKILQVSFPDGSELPVTYLQEDSLAIPRMTQANLDNYLTTLIGLANNGNSSAADELYQRLSKCPLHVRDTEEFKQRIGQFESTGVYEFEQSPPSDIVYRMPRAIGSERHQSLVFQFKLAQRLCRSVSIDVIEDRQIWLDKAFELADYRLLTAVASSYSAKNDELASYQVYQRLWDEGHVAVGYAIAVAYRQGIPESANGQPDYLTAYAYHLAQDQVTKTGLLEFGYLDAANRIASMDQSLAISAGHLSPLEQSKAEALAVELIRNNKKCCINLWQVSNQ